MNKKIIVLILSIIGVLLIIGGSTYSALFKVNETDKQSYSTGTLQITSNATNGSISLANAIPMTDSDGEESTPYTFKITNTGNLTYKFNVKFLSTTIENQITSSYIKLKIDDGEILTLNSLTEGIIKEDIVLEGGKSITFTLRVWLDISTPNTEIGKVFNAKITTEGYAITSPEQASTLTLMNLGLNDLLQSGTPDFTTTATTDEGIYAAEDDLGTSYYFRGASENNYVKFGKNSSGSDMYWRIIRINGDGTIRMIYDGTQAHDNGTSSTDRIVGTSKFNSNYDSNAYVGYMYGSTLGSTYALEHSNDVNSTIKTYLEGELSSTNTGWYYENIIATGYDEYVADAIYCNDRSLYSGTGVGYTYTKYGAYGRLYANKTTSVNPVLTCEREEDRFTSEPTVGNVTGNDKLKYPVGLITADEVSMAGGISGTNTNYYLYKGQTYWPMSASDFAEDGVAISFLVNSTGRLIPSGSMGISHGVCPVLSLKADALQYSETSNGTKDYPFTVPEPEEVELTSTQVLTNLGLDDLLNEGEPDFTTVATTDEGIYAAEDDLGTSYYFRGASENNYVKFGKNSSGSDMYWRIIRINGDGTIRMIYDGTSAHDNGTSSTDRYVGTSVFNDDYMSNAYVGYMYGSLLGSTYEEEHANDVNSKIKTYLEGELTSTNTGWYYENIIATGYDDYVADAIYCNDRSLDTSDSSYTGRGSTTTYYGAYQRLARNYTTSVKPVLTCEREEDRFTSEPTMGSVTGNDELKYPVGLITADEVAMAGGLSETTNSDYYLYKGHDYWTMSASSFVVDFEVPSVFNVFSTGILFPDAFVDVSYGVCPVLSLSSTAIIDGTGEKGDPFRVE